MEIGNNFNPCAIIRVRDLERYTRPLRTAQRQLVQEYGLRSSGRIFYAGPSGVFFDAGRVRNVISGIADPAAADLINLASTFALKGHSGQYRKSGEPYFVHPFSVAEIVAGWGRGAEDRAAAFCHDLIEDGRIGGGRVTRDFLREKLGERVAQLVEGVTELGKEPQFKGAKPSLVDIFIKWLEYGARDLSTILIKLADRLHNMRTLAYTDPETQVKKAKETLNVYSRIADRLGMWEMKREIEDLSFRYLRPEVYQEIETKRKEIIEASAEKVDRIVQTLREDLDKTGLRIEIIREERFIYELHQRMERRKISLKDLSWTDIWRINIVVPEEENCFEVLRRAHKLYRPNQSEIRDHIHDPRSNGHQFLQTYLKVPGFGSILIQIRDQKMQMNYRLGVLSKPGEKMSNAWIVALLREIKEEQAIPESDFYDMLARFMVPVIIYTEEGDKHTLPFGSTPLDFARKIHRDIFLRAESVRINGRPAELFQQLQEGDTVYVVTNPEARPSIDWRAHIHTRDAAQTLRSYLGKREPAEIFEDAISILDQASRKHSIAAKRLLETLLFRRYYGSLGFLNPEDLLMEIGAGKRTAEKVISEILELYRSECRKMGSSGFLVGEFSGDMTISKLCQAINGDYYGVAFNAPDNSIERLNELLEAPGFYDIWLKKNKKVALSKEIDSLINTTKDDRSKLFAELKEAQQMNIKRLNRLLLEVTYPQTCPKSRKMLESGGLKTEPYYLSIKTTDRIGLTENLVHPLRGIGFNVRDIFPVYSEEEKEKGKVIMVLGVDVHGGRMGGGMVGQFQRLQVHTIAEQVLTEEESSENIAIITKEDVVRLLRQKIDRTKMD